MLKISTFNIQNDIKNYSIDKTNIIIKYLKDYNIDILNLQEVYSKLNFDLNVLLEKMDYYSYGKYRFFFKRIFNRINEKTPVITNREVIFNKTYNLPFFPSTLKRVLTKVEILYKGRRISIYNTHLDYKSIISRKRQLKRIFKIIKKDTNPIILTGDFNLKTNRTIFIDFMKKLEKLNIYHVDIAGKTFKPSQYRRGIDHIFLSKDFKVLDKKIIHDIPISDHYPVLISVEFVGI